MLPGKNYDCVLIF